MNPKPCHLKPYMRVQNAFDDVLSTIHQFPPPPWRPDGAGGSFVLRRHRSHDQGLTLLHFSAQR